MKTTLEMNMENKDIIINQIINFIKESDELILNKAKALVVKSVSITDTFTIGIYYNKIGPRDIKYLRDLHINIPTDGTVAKIKFDKDELVITDALVSGYQKLKENTIVLSRPDNYVDHLDSINHRLDSIKDTIDTINEDVNGLYQLLQ